MKFVEIQKRIYSIESCYFCLEETLSEKKSMKTQITYFAILFSLLFAACNSSSHKNETSEESKTQPKFPNENQLEEKMAAIENNKDLLVVNSLNYNNNAGSTASAIAYLDAEKNTVKMDEVFSDVTNGNYGTHTFYIENGKKIVSKEVYFDNELKVPIFVERISFYNKNQKVIYTKERTAEYEEDLPKMQFQIAKLKECSLDRTMRILNQEKDFETTFQGFASDGSTKFLLVGENTPDGFASSLAVQRLDKEIEKLSNNEKAMIGKKLEIQYDVMVDEQGLTFQILQSLTILN